MKTTKDKPVQKVTGEPVIKEGASKKKRRKVRAKQAGSADHRQADFQNSPEVQLDEALKGLDRSRTVHRKFNPVTKWILTLRIMDNRIHFLHLLCRQKSRIAKLDSTESLEQMHRLLHKYFTVLDTYQMLSNKTLGSNDVSVYRSNLILAVEESVGICEKEHFKDIFIRH